MNIALRLFAGVIDLLQFIFFITLLAFQFMTPVGGGVAGAVSGAVLCWNLSTGVWESFANAAACAAGGGALGTGLGFIGAPAAIAIDIAISCTFGVLLILLLWVSGRFSLMATLIGFTSEMLPGINGFVPGWSLLVHRCIQQYKKAQKEGTSTSRTSVGILTTAAKLVPALGGGTAAALLRKAPAAAPSAKEPSEKSNRIPLQTRNFDGIRPANDNRPQSYAQAA